MPRRRRRPSHGLRYTFTDLVRLANVDAVVRRALTGHVTEEMQRHYSTVGMDEKRAAVAGVLRVLDGGLSKSGTNGGTAPKAEGQTTLEGSTSRPVRTANSNTSLERDTGFEPATFSLGS